MTILKFTDTHNMVAFLSKPAKSDGFEQIVDFLNAQPIRYALTVNPTIYISCIEQFCSTGMVKTINGEVQLHALVDGKKIIISEASVRRDLKLEDEEVFLEQQLDDLSTHNSIYIAPSHIKKIFRNMRRVGKGFSDRVTPLFQTKVVQNQAEIGEGSANPTDPHHTPTFIQPSLQPQKTQKPWKPKRKDAQVPQPSDPSDNVVDEAVHKELGNSLVRATTTAFSLEAEQDSGNITKTRSMVTPNESSSLGTTSSGGPRCQETMGDIIAQTRLKLNELMELCTNLQKKVLDLEKTKTTQANEIASLKRRVKKLEKKNRSRTHNLKRLYKFGLTARVESFSDEENLVSVQDDADKEMFDVDTLNGEEVFVAGKNENVVEEVVDAAQVSTAATTVTITTEEINLAQALADIKSTKPKAKGIAFREPVESTTTIFSQQLQDKGLSQDKGKGILVEPEKPLKKKDQLKLDEEIALKLQTEIDEEERIARVEEAKINEANIA
ncbi:hypothetical protein Tco_0730030 [Tanacetum coccineum]|uniref:Uncharacterized protein n=1 Tax=Tanacetum coccineum TaxID=301880 RepID=A0ABQ4YQK1_9ASTR